MSIRCDCRATIVLHYNHIMIMMIMNIVKVESVWEGERPQQRKKEDSSSHVHE